MKKKVLNISDLYRGHHFYWIDSMPTLKRWIVRDYLGKNFLGTIIIKNEGRGHRYLIPEENIPKFVKAFEQNRLTEQPTFDRAQF